MAMIHLPPDFKEFLKLLNSNQVEYLLIGGYAVGYHGYPRATADLDIWIAISPENGIKLVGVLKEFGFDLPELTPELFQEESKVIRMGVPPIRIELITTIDGVRFDECYASRIEDKIDEILVYLIDLNHLKINKKASGRYKDLNDLEHLP
jgi:hypothetical protein